ncbi:MAG: transglutaminase family protein [Lacipirellulaceae bacterium]
MPSRSPAPQNFLASCEVIDFDNPDVAALAACLKRDNSTDTAQACFEFVRDEIKHSSDHQLNPVTCTASEVLKHGTGYCYAKSHLLCALIRANGISAGMTYQRLSIDGEGPPFCLHGLNAVYLEEHGWYRIDPRGNRDDVDAQFDPPHEKLAFATNLPGEYDLASICAKPMPIVLKALRAYTNWCELGENLPDVQQS